MAGKLSENLVWGILLASALTWAALLFSVPGGGQTKLFFTGSGMFGDYMFPRVCAALDRHYGGVEDEASFSAVKTANRWRDPRMVPIMERMGRSEWPDGFPRVLEKQDCCYPPICLAIVSLFPVSHAGSMACTAVGALLLLAALTLLTRSPWTLAAMMLSSVTLFAIERGQLVLYSAAGVTVFLAWWNSGSRAKRIFAAFALAFAAVTKISPAVFGLMYLTRKDGWKSVEPWLAGIAAVLMFAVPFAFYGGVEAFTEWMSNAAANSAEYTRCGTWGTIALDRAVRVFRGLDVQTPWPSMKYFRMIDMALGLVCLWRGWRTASVFLLAAAMLLLPGNMLFYTGVYLLPALLVGREVPVGPGKPLFAISLFLLLTPIQLPPFGVSRTLACVAFLSLTAMALRNGGVRDLAVCRRTVI